MSLIHATMDSKGANKTSKTKVIRPSPNEEEAIIRNALAARRKERLLQVRRQEKKLSGNICNAVKNKREEDIKALKLQKQRQWNIKISEEIEGLEEEYRKRIESLGEGHKSADKIPSKDLTEANHLMEERALTRYEEALKKLAEQRAALKMLEEEKTTLRHKVAKTEQIRASAIASKPPPVQDFVLKLNHAARHSTMSSRTKTTDSFSSTRFHMPVVYAEKASDQPQVDPREAARNLEERIKDAKELLEKDLNERKEKAHLRHQHARQQVLLDQSKDRLLEQLEGLEFKDRARRQQVLSTIPKQVFQPPYQRIEDAKAKQIMLEEAFENAHVTKKDIHQDELELDLESKLQDLERDLAQEENLLQEEVDLQSNVPHLAPRGQSRPPMDEVSNAAITIPGQVSTSEHQKRSADPSKRMQKLLGRIRKQQEEWSKQNVDRKSNILSEETKEEQEITETESSESLVSANIESARLTNSNTETIEIDDDENKQHEELSSRDDKKSNEVSDERDSLLHPIEKAKIIRSAGKRPSESAEKDMVSNTPSLDVDKRKKTLENQKYLLKIQKQRLENQLLRRDLQTTGKALGLLAEEDGHSSDQESLSSFSYPDSAESNDGRDGYVNNKIEVDIEEDEDMEPRLDIKGDTDGPSDPKEQMIGVEMEGHQKHPGSSFAGKNITGEDSVRQAELSLVSGLSDIQREELTKRYPNIFKGLSFDHADKERAQSRVEQTPVSEINLNSKPAGDGIIPQNDSGIQGIDKAETTLADRIEESRVKESSKPKIEIDRIRKYQEQLLQKQKWLKSRHDVIQKRHQDMLNEITSSNAKTAENQVLKEKDKDNERLALHEGIDGRYSSVKGLSLSETAEPIVKQLGNLQDKSEIDRSWANLAKGKEMLSVSDNTNYQGYIVAPGQNDKQVISQQSLLIHPSNDEPVTGIPKHEIIENQKNRLDDVMDEIRRLERHGNGKVLATQDQHGMETLVNERSRTQSNLDNLETLINEIDSIHLQATTAIADTNVPESQASDVVLKKSHRIITGKPAFSPIQEVEETSFKERNIGTSTTRTQGTASGSPLAEQELPSSSRTSSDHFSPVRSTKSNERSELSSAFSLRELISSLSETDYLALPIATTAIPKKRSPISAMLPKESPMRHSSDSGGTNTWTPLQPYYSGPKDDSHIVIHTDQHRMIQVPNNTATTGPATFENNLEFPMNQVQRKESPMRQSSNANTWTPLQPFYSGPKDGFNAHTDEYRTRQTPPNAAEDRENLMRKASDLKNRDTDTWTPLQPYLSGLKNVDGHAVQGVTRHTGQISENPAIAGPITSNINKSLDFDEDKYSRLLQEHLRFRNVALKNDDFEAEPHRPAKNQDFGDVISLQEHANSVATGHELRLPDTPQYAAREQSSTTSLRETKPISVESSSSNLSKGSSTNMAKYEEILERVRMLPYRHQEEYNKLSESYESWRKETVEPLLQPNIPDPFSGYEISTTKKLDFEMPSPVDEGESHILKGSSIIYQPFEAPPIDSLEDVQARIQLHDPVTEAQLHREEEETSPGGIRGGESYVEEGASERTNHEMNSIVHTENALSFNGSLALRNSIELRDENKLHATAEDRHRDRFSIDVQGSLLSDQLVEQTLFGTFDENDSNRGTLHLTRQERPGSSYAETMDDRHHYDLQLNWNDVKMKPATDFVSSKNKQIEEYNSPSHAGILERDISDFDIEAIQRRFLEQYVSSFGSSSATKSSLTNSSNRMTKSLLSSDLKSDETVSELARLWPLTSQSAKADAGEGEAARSQTSTIQTSSFNSSSNTSKISSSSTSNSSNVKRLLIKKHDSLSDHSLGFKDPNNYDISLYKSASLKTSKLDAQSYKSDDSAGLPTIPQFASTRLVSDELSSQASSESPPPVLNIELPINDSLQSHPFNDTVEGHSDTSWLLPSSSIKMQPDTTPGAIQQSSNDVLASVSFHGLDSDIPEEGLAKDSRESPVTNSSHDDDDATRTWNELLAAQVSGSSAKESDGELPEVLKLKRDAFIRRSKQRLQQSKKEDARKDHQHTKFRVDGRVERSDRSSTDKENKKPTKASKIMKKSNALPESKSHKGSKSHLSSQSDKQKQTNQEILQENRRRVKQFQKKIQSSLRSRKR